MTIALTIKVNDGLVLSADSATTMVQYTEDGPSVINIYNNANKVFQLHKLTIIDSGKKNNILSEKIKKI